VQAPMPQISESNSKKIHTIEACKEDFQDEDAALQGDSVDTILIQNEFEQTYFIR
jgi:hypothetical protein